MTVYDKILVDGISGVLNVNFGYWWVGEWLSMHIHYACVPSVGWHAVIF